MRMSMGVSQRITISIPCPGCGTRQETHEPGCPKVILDELISRQKHIECPKCYAHSVDINKEDFYECRKCQTQYTTAELDDSFERVRLIIDWDAPISEGVRSVLVYPEKGNGEFPIDEAIAKVQEEMAKRARKTRKRRK